MALPEDNKTILAREYKLYLPSQTQLIDEVNSVREMMEHKSHAQNLDGIARFHTPAIDKPNEYEPRRDYCPYCNG